MAMNPHFFLALWLLFTIHLQDFHDFEGDRLTKRQALPIILPHGAFEPCEWPRPHSLLAAVQPCHFGRCAGKVYDCIGSFAVLVFYSIQQQGMSHREQYIRPQLIWMKLPIANIISSPSSYSLKYHTALFYKKHWEISLCRELKAEHGRCHNQVLTSSN
jgi:hypothetical protein